MTLLLLFQIKMKLAISFKNCYTKQTNIHALHTTCIIYTTCLSNKDVKYLRQAPKPGLMLHNTLHMGKIQAFPHVYIYIHTLIHIQGTSTAKTQLKHQCESKETAPLPPYIHTVCQKTQTKLLGQQ